MKIAYMLFVYNTPLHTAKLIRKLDSPNASFIIHVDRKYDLAPYAAMCSDNVQLTTSRVPVYWGDFSQIDAMRILIRDSLALSPRCDRFVLLSGADYPIRTNEEIQDFFENHPKDELINMRPMPCEEIGKPVRRLNTYVLRPNLSPASRLISRVGRKLGIVPHIRDYRQHFGALQPFGGSTWWSITRDAAERVVRFQSDHPKIHTYFQNTELPDESYVHTVIGNSPLADNVTRNITYADWSQGGSNPAIITASHVERLLKTPNFRGLDPFGEGEILFARKFPDQSDELTDIIDRAHLATP